MRTTIFKTALAIGILATMFPQVVLATTPSFSCSSNLVISLDNGYSASCDGDFSFNDGVLHNDNSISLTAGGLLHIGENATLSSPFINLSGNDFYQAGVLYAPGGTISISTTNETFTGNSTWINFADMLTKQTIPNAISNWNTPTIDL